MMAENQARMPGLNLHRTNLTCHPTEVSINAILMCDVLPSFHVPVGI